MDVDRKNLKQEVNVLYPVNGITLGQRREFGRYHGPDGWRNVHVFDEARDVVAEVEFEASLDYLPLEKKFV